MGDIIKFMDRGNPDSAASKQPKPIDRHRT